MSYFMGSLVLFFPRFWWQARIDNYKPASAAIRSPLSRNSPLGNFCLQMSDLARQEILILFSELLAKYSNSRFDIKFLPKSRNEILQIAPRHPALASGTSDEVTRGHLVVFFDFNSS